MGGRLGTPFEKEGIDDPVANARRVVVSGRRGGWNEPFRPGDRVREATEGERNYSLPIRLIFSLVRIKTRILAAPGQIRPLRVCGRN